MPAPFMSILTGFAEAQIRAQRLAFPLVYRCPECGAVTRREGSDNPPPYVACFAAYRDEMCTGRARREPAHAD